MKNIRLHIVLIIGTLCLLLIFTIPKVYASSLFLESWGVTVDEVEGAYDAGPPGRWQNYTPDAPRQTWSRVTGEEVDFDNPINVNVPNYGFVNPGYGGQPFDAEALYFGYDTDYLYLALISGTPLDGAPDPWSPIKYLPGDIFIDIIGSGVLWDYALDVDKGKMISSITAIENCTDYNEADPWRVKEGTEYNVVEFQYAPFVDGDSTTYSAQWNNNDPGYGPVDLSKHYAIEAKVAFADLTGGTNPFIGQTINLHWTMECGNDILDAKGFSSGPPIHSTPEPGTMVLIALGIISIVGADIKKRRVS